MAPTIRGPRRPVTTCKSNASPRISRRPGRRPLSWRPSVFAVANDCTSREHGPANPGITSGGVLSPSIVPAMWAAHATTWARPARSAPDDATRVAAHRLHERRERGRFRQQRVAVLPPVPVHTESLPDAPGPDVAEPRDRLLAPRRGRRRASTASSFWPPQVGWRPRSASSASATAGGVAVGELCGRRDRSCSPAGPSAS
jgi:hypothetical protein